ncbi:hypothetical protein YC2023_104615 [Brassica napus]
MNRSDLNNYRSGPTDEQGRLLKGSAAMTPARNTNVLFGQQEKPKLMDLFPTMPSEGLRTLPLLSQLEERTPQDTATEQGGAISSSIDLTLRLENADLLYKSGLGAFTASELLTENHDDHEDKDQDIQIGFPTDVKHVAHIGSDGPAANMPSWMGDFKPQEHENGQVVSRGDVTNNPIGEGVGLQELLPPPEKQKHKKTRRKSETTSQNGSPPRRSSNASTSDMLPKHSRRHSRSRHGSMDSSNDPSVRRKRVVSVNEAEGSDPLSDSSTTRRKSTSRHRKVKGSEGGGEVSMKKTKAKPESSIVQPVDVCNDGNTSNKD